MAKEGEGNQVLTLRIVASNDLDRLVEALKNEFFSEGGNPFEKRIVVVPHAGFKDFLFERLLGSLHLPVVTGIQVLPLNQAVQEILYPSRPETWNWTASKSRGSTIASPLCISNTKGPAIVEPRVLSRGSNSKFLADWGISGSQPLERWQKQIPSFIELSLAISEQLRVLAKERNFPLLLRYLGEEDVEKQQRRISLLSEELARVFARYGLYGKQFLPSWLEEEGWQQVVWKRVFSPSSFWSYPLELFSKATPCFSGKVALFGFSHLSLAHLSFFSSVSATYFYPCPCAHFWEDFASDKERTFMNRMFAKKGGKEKVRAELNQYLQEGHPLLKNWGKLGKEMAKQLDHFLLDEKEIYEEGPQKTLLGQLKHSLLTLEETQDLKTDASIQIHSAGSLLREVEIVRDLIETLIQEALCRGEKISLRQIVVAAPQISLYAPYIHMVFSQSAFAYSIEGLPLGLSDASQGFLELIEFPGSNYALDDLFKMMRRSSLLQKRGFSLAELNRLKEWFHRANISQGLSNWQEGLDRLVFGLAMIPDEKELLDVWPLGIVPHSDIDLLNRFLEFFTELKTDLGLFAFKRVPSDWFELFLSLAAKYFVIDSEKEPFFQELKTLALSCRTFQQGLSFEDILQIVRHLSQIPSGKKGGSQWEKISFVPLAQGTLKTAKILVCLGMDEGAFPRSEGARSLCEMHTDYAPKQGDLDRFLMLEMLLHTQEHLIFTYQRTHPEDAKHQGPSPLIEELEHYVQGVMKIDHPAFTFDPCYFSADAPVKKWSREDYLAAQACQLPPLATPSFFCNRAPSSDKEIVVSIKQLKKLARSPVQFYLNEVLKIYLQEEEDREESEFLISYLNKSKLRKQAVGASSVLQALHKSRAQGGLPKGLFQAAAKEEFEEEIEDLFQALKGFDVCPDEVSAVHFSLDCQQEEAGYHPPLVIPLSDSRIVRIVGTLEEITPKGLLVLGPCDFKALVRAWPLYLIYCCLNPNAQSLLLAAKGKKIDIPLSDPKEWLKGYLEYFLLAKQKPSPLMPDWAKAILKGEEETFSKAMAQETKDLYLNYLKRRGFSFESKVIFDFWQEPLLKTFLPLIQGENDAL